MYKKRIIFFVIMVLLMTGCTIISNETNQVVDTVMNDKEVRTNTVSMGYELYIPTGVGQISDNEYNQKFKIKDRFVYLYVDIISYYYKNTLNFKKTSDYSYFYRELNYNGKTGYIGINKVEDDLYFCEIVYNYAKMEFYSDSNDLEIILANSLIVIKSIKYNDKLISVRLDSGVSDGREKKYELDSPKDTESKFESYLQEYIPPEEEEVVLPVDD